MTLCHNLFSSLKGCNWGVPFCGGMKSGQVVGLKTIVFFRNSVNYRPSEYIF